MIMVIISPRFSKISYVGVMRNPSDADRDRLCQNYARSIPKRLASQQRTVFLSFLPFSSIFLFPFFSFFLFFLFSFFVIEIKSVVLHMLQHKDTPSMSNALHGVMLKKLSFNHQFDLAYLIGVVDKIDIIRKQRLATRLNCQCKYRNFSRACR